MPKALSYISKNAPDYQVRFRHDLSRNVQLEVQRGNIDVGIVINPVEVPDVVIRKIATDTVSVWSGKSGFDKDTVICNTSLFQTQHILRKWKNKPWRVIDTDSLELICRLVAAGLGFGIVPGRAVDLMGLRLQQVKSLPTYHDQICLVYRPEFGANRAESLIVEAMKTSLN